jgi:Putative prokaryotic signal transducing protein
MQTLYQPSNAVEGHMLAHLLQQQGIEATVLGEHLQG